MLNHWVLRAGLVATLMGCSAGSESAPANTVIPLEVVDVRVNPYGNAPLVAVVVVENPALADPNLIEIRLEIASTRADCLPTTASWDPRAGSYAAAFDAAAFAGPGQLAVPVLGLCPDTDHTVSLEILGEGWLGSARATLYTSLLPDLSAEVVTVHAADLEAMAPGWTWVDNRVYDHTGMLRWVGTARVEQPLPTGVYQSKIDQFDWLGRRTQARSLPETMAWHHTSLVLPNGNVVLCVEDATTTIRRPDDNEPASVEDALIEIDPDTSEVVNYWDLRAFLDTDRDTVIVKSGDWFHLNAVAYDEESDAIVVSGRYQGLVKLSRNGEAGPLPNVGIELQWILAPWLDWGLAGWDGGGPLDPNDFLLTAVDETGEPWPDAVQRNLEAEEDFHWPVGQHGVHVRSRGAGIRSVLTFSNQGSFVFDGPGTVNNGVSFVVQGDLANDRAVPPYSLLVEYLVDENEGTVQEVWSFGADDPELYGSYQGGVNAFEETGTRMMISNGTDQHDPKDVLNPHVVEIADDGTVVFHLEIEETSFSAFHGGRVSFPAPWTGNRSP